MWAEAGLALKIGLLCLCVCVCVSVCLCVFASLKIAFRNAAKQMGKENKEKFTMAGVKQRERNLEWNVEKVAGPKKCRLHSKFPLLSSFHSKEQIEHYMLVL